MPSKTSGLFRGLLLLPIARWLVAAPPSASPAPPPERPPFPLLRLTGAVLGSAALIAGTIVLTNMFDETVPTIGDPPPTGSIHLYFDRPDVTAQLDVDVTSELVTYENKDYASDSYVIRVLAEGIDQGDPPVFYLALGGSALPQDGFPDGSERGEADNGCSLAVSSGVPDLSCLTTKGSPDSASVAHEAKEEIVVVSGTLQPIGDQQGLAYVDLTADAQTLAKAAEIEVFQLPTVGTTYIPDTVGEDVEIAVDNVQGLKVPEPLTIVVQYQWLALTDQLDSESVAPVSRQPLIWVETFRTTLTASGTITDTREQRNADRVTFFWGVAAGILGSFLIPVLALWGATIVGFWRWASLPRVAKRSRSS